MNCARLERDGLGIRIWLAWAALLLALWPLSSAESARVPSLKVGDPAPAFQPGRWLHGEALPQLPRKQAAVLLFWAGDHPFNRGGLRRLDALRDKYKTNGVAFVGVCLSQAISFTEYSARQLGEKFSLPLATDTVNEQGQGKMAATWLDAAGQDAVPVVFVLEAEGRIAWIGHPYGLTEKLLSQVCGHTFDLAKARTVYAEALRNEAALAGLWQGMQASLEEENNWPQAKDMLDRMEKLAHPDDRPGLGALRFQLLMPQGDFQAAAKLAVQLSDAHPEEPWLQNLLAWEWATNEGFENRDYDLIEKIARRANAAAYERDGAIMDTLARALFLKGRKEEATKLQERAVKLADEELRPQLERALRSYQQGLLPPAEPTHHELQ